MVASLILRRAATALRTPSTPLPTLASRTAPRYPVSASRIAFPTRFYATPSDRKPGQGADEAAPKDPTEPGSSQAGSSDAKAEAPRAPPRGGSAFDVDTSAPEHAARTQASLTEQLVDADSAGAASQATGDSATGASGDVATTPGQSGAGGQGRTGAKAKAKSMSSIERRRQHTTRALGAAVLAALGFAGWELGRDWDTEKEWLRHREDPLSESFFGRMRLRFNDMIEDFNNPVWEKLLPDPLPFPYGRPYTLVVDLEGLLLHSEWSREKGWRSAKRPGLDYFLGYLSQWYEIVLFTTQPSYTVLDSVLPKLDPDRRFFAYTLFRESCRTKDGKVVKDLSFLNRDLSKVIVLDTDEAHFAAQPENGIKVSQWKGEPKDRELVGLIPFLESIGIYGIEDVRPTLKAYEGTHIPTEHGRREKEIKDAQVAEWEARRGKLGAGGLFGSLGRSQATAGSDGPPKSWLELERERYQQGYMEEQKYWRENGDALRRQAKEEQDRQIKEMKLSAWGMLTGQGMQPPSQGEQAQTQNQDQPSPAQ